MASPIDRDMSTPLPGTARACLPVRPPRRLTPVACALLLAACASTGPDTVDALRAGPATRLGAEELKTLIPGARVVYTDPRGTTSTWWNNDDGTLTATQDRTTLAIVSGRGRWRLGADATYCIAIEWQSGATGRWFESNCHQLWRLEDTYYGAAPGAAGPQRPARFRFQHPIRQEPLRP
jgi:hypothetical protein